jgi:hypothetical protein
VLTHNLTGAIAILKKAGIGDFTFELFETLAFTLNQKIEVHNRGSEADRPRPESATPATIQLRTFAGTRGLGAAVTPREFFYAPGGVDEFLFACEKRMASGADADFNVSFGRAGVINRAARANDVGLLIIGMNVRLHVQKRAQNLAVKAQIRK